MAIGKKTGGRQKGTPNKVTAEIREYAQQFTTDAIDGLSQIARTSTSDAARVAAWNSILDRGHGKPIQGVDVEVALEITGITRTIIDPKVINHDDDPSAIESDT